MTKGLNNQQLLQKAKEMRIELMEMLCEAGSGHSGGSLSSMDILAVLYNNIMKHDPKNPQDPTRDRFVLSKGHVCPALYVVLADCGYYDKKELMTLRKYGSILQGHPYMHKTPGIDVSSGSLGQGLSIAVGMAMAAQMDQKDNRVYCLMGDGEIQEGQIWEAAMAAGHYKLDNLCGIVDVNRLQIDGKVEDVMNLNPLPEKWASFNWHVIRVDGHDVNAIEAAFNEAREHRGQPSVILADTVKGKGVSFMENKASWHGVSPNPEQRDAAVCEIRED